MEESHRRARIQFRLRTLLLLPVAIAVVLGFAMQTLRDHKRVYALHLCPRRLGAIAVLMKMYAQVHGAPPPAWVSDAHNRRVHSWRALILPRFRDYLDYSRKPPLLYEYEYTVPWDQGDNAALTELLPYVYGGNGYDESLSTGNTNFVAIIDGSKPLSEPTILAIADVASSGIKWSEPRDMTIDELAELVNAPGFRGPHEDRSFYMLFSGGELRCFTPDSFRKDVFRGRTGACFCGPKSWVDGLGCEEVADYYAQRGVIISREASSSPAP